MQATDETPKPKADEPQTALVKQEPKIVRAKDVKGRFISKRDKLSSERYTIKRREFLEAKDPKNPKKSRAEIIDEELYELVQLGTTDPTSGFSDGETTTLRQGGKSSSAL